MVKLQNSLLWVKVNNLQGPLTGLKGKRITLENTFASEFEVKNR